MRDLYDLPPAMFGRRIGLDIKGQHVRTEDLLDPAVHRLLAETRHP